MKFVDSKFFYASICNSKNDSIDANGVESDNKINDNKLVNDYYFFKKVLSETETNWPDWVSEEEIKLLKEPKSAQLAYVLENSFVYRVLSVERENLFVEFDAQKRRLNVVIPNKWLEFDKSNREPLEREYTQIKHSLETWIFEEENNRPIKKLWNEYDSNYADTSVLKTKIKEVSGKLQEMNVPIKRIPDGKSLFFIFTREN